MAGYSSAGLPKKLGIKEGFAVGLWNEPGAHSDLAAGESPFDVALAFCRNVRDLEAAWDQLSVELTPAGGLWLAWPKKASGVTTELSDQVVREFGLSQGWVDNKVCAVDEVWSALRFVVRRKDRAT